jgi:Ser/Thr protein kinase RdoA (MazF antagonist)
VSAYAELSSDGGWFWEGDDWGWRPLWMTAAQVMEHARACFDVAVRTANLLAGGLLNQTWLLRSGDGDRDRDRVLRVGRPERTLDQVLYEQTLSRAWTVRVPQLIAAETDAVPVRSEQDQVHVLSLFPFCPGVSGTVVPAAHRLIQLAPAMATMHGTALELDVDQRPGMISVDDEPVALRWAAARQAVEDRFGHGPNVMQTIGEVDRAVDEVDNQIQRWRASGRLEPRAAVHGDLNARNQLYRDGGLVGIIDTDDCRVEPLISEVAGLAYSDPAVSPDAAWECYRRAGGPLHPTDRELLLPFARLGTLSELQWITDDTGAATHLGLKTLEAIAEDLAGTRTRG